MVCYTVTMSENCKTTGLHLLCIMRAKNLSISALFFLIFSCTDISDKNETATTTTQVNNSAIFLKESYKKVQANPDSLQFRLDFIYALDSLQNYPEALKHIDTLIASDSLNYSFWYVKGHVAENAQDTVLAIHAYTNAITIYDSPDALLALANLYAERKDARALQITSHIQSLALGREYDAHAAFIAGIYYARTGVKNNALKMFDKSIADNYTYMEAYIEKGLVYFDAKEFEKALEVFQFATTVNSMYADAWYYQGRCYEMMNKKEEAIEKFKQSLKLDNTLEESRKALQRLGAA